jgi:hypothetical protein
MAVKAQLLDGTYTVRAPIPALGAKPGDELIVNGDDDYPLILSRSQGLTPRMLLSEVPRNAIKRVSVLLGGQLVIFDVKKPVRALGALPGDVLYLNPTDLAAPVSLCREFRADALSKVPTSAVEVQPEAEG